ncbi:MAG: hypothetical protein Kow0092_04410 [Deferrisomatales bacterium]
MPNRKRLLAAALCAAALAFVVDSTSAAAFKRVHVGESAPPFTLPDVDGNPVSLESYRSGPLTVVTFWALWSPKSAPLLEDLQKLVDEFGTRGLQVHALAVNAEGATPPADLRDRIRAFIGDHGITFPVLVDEGLEQYNAWGVIATPSTAFLGKDFQVLYDLSGHPSGAYEEMREQVVKALGIEEEVAREARPRRERYRAPKRATLNYGLCRTLCARGQFAKAARKLKRLLAQEPDFPEAHALNGAVHLGLAREGRPGAEEAARQAFARAVELDPTVPQGLAGLAHFALADGKTADALELVRRAVEYTEDPDLPELPASQEPETDDGERRAELTARLDRAQAALDAGDAEGARALLAPVVDGLLGLPDAPARKPSLKPAGGGAPAD